MHEDDVFGLQDRRKLHLILRVEEFDLLPILVDLFADDIEVGLGSW